MKAKQETQDESCLLDNTETEEASGFGIWADFV